MNLTALLISQHEKSGDQLNNINVFIAQSLIYIVENYFLQLAPSFVLTLSCRRGHTCNFYNNLLGKLFTTWHAPPPMQIIQMPLNDTLYVPGRRYCNLILVDSFESFRAIDVVQYTAKYNINEYYFIFLQTREYLIDTEMASIFEYCWQNQIINCNVQIQTANGELFIYTYYPYTQNNCGATFPKLINQFKGTTLVKKILFPKKLLNFYGCRLRAALWDVPPFVFMQKHKNDSVEITHGIETRLIFELAKQLNFTLEVLEPPNEEQRGVVKGNNLTGALLMLDKRIADFSFGCFRLAYDRAIVTTATFSYYQGYQIVCVPMAAYTFSSIEILLYPFAASTWLLLFAIYVILMAFLTALKKYQKLYPDFFGRSPMNLQLNLFLMIMGMPANSMPLRLFGRLVCTDWMFFTLIIRTAYQALLFHLIRTQPTNRVPTSLDELVKYNYTVVVNRGTYLALDDVQFLRQLHLQVINKSEETVAFEYIAKHPRNRLVAAGPLDFLGYYAIANKMVDVFRLLPQRILALPITMYLTKHSFLIDQFDEILIRMSSMGLLDIWAHWELDYKYVRSAHDTENKCYGLDELYMIFVIGFAGILISLLIFILELLSKRVETLKRLFMNV